MAVFPRNCAEQEVQNGGAAAGGHRGVATRKTTGDLTTRRGTGDPERRAEWTSVTQWPPPVCTGRGRSLLRTEWEPPTLRVHFCVVSTRFGASSVDAQTRRCDPTRSLFRKFTWSAERSNSPAHPCLCGLRASMRHPERRRVVQCGEGLEGASDPVHLSNVCREADTTVHRSREFAATSWWFHRFPSFFALTGCGRRCAVLLVSVLRRVCGPHTGTSVKGKLRKMANYYF